MYTIYPLIENFGNGTGIPSGQAENFLSFSVITQGSQTSIFRVMWNYVVTANKPTAVSHSLVGNFTSPTDLNLIIRYSEFLNILQKINLWLYNYTSSL